MGWKKDLNIPSRAALLVLFAALTFGGGGASAETQAPFAKGPCDSKSCDIWTIANLRFDGEEGRVCSDIRDERCHPCWAERGRKICAPILADVAISGSRLAVDGRSLGPATHISYFVTCSDAEPSVTRQPSNIKYSLDKRMFNPSYMPTDYPVLYNLWWAVCRNERLKFASSNASPPAQSQVVPATQANGPNRSKAATVSDKEKDAIIFIYQQYLVLKSCEANSNGVIALNATREALKRFDQSIRAKGYDPEALFAQAKEVPFNESLKILLLSVTTILPMAQDAEKAQILSVCQRMIESEAQAINLAVGSSTPDKKEIDKLGEKDF